MRSPPDPDAVHLHRAARRPVPRRRNQLQTPLHHHLVHFRPKAPAHAQDRRSAEARHLRAAEREGVHDEVVDLVAELWRQGEEKGLVVRRFATSAAAGEQEAISVSVDVDLRSTMTGVSPCCYSGGAESEAAQAPSDGHAARFSRIWYRFLVGFAAIWERVVAWCCWEAARWCLAKFAWCVQVGKAR